MTRSALAVLLVSLAASSATAQSHKLNPPLARADVGYVSYERLSPDGAWAVYVGAQETARLELFSARLEGTELPIKLSQPAQSASNDIHAFLISADSRRVVYVDDGGLLSVPIDGSASPLQLDLGFVGEFQISPDGQRVVYRRHTGSAFELFSASIEASRPPVRLNGPLVPGGQVGSYPSDPSFAISPGGERVVYLADQERDGMQELYSVPIEGRSAPLKLNGPLRGHGDVTGFRFSPDGQRVLYRADQELNNQFDLYSVPVDGREEALRLNDPATFDVQPDFALSPDGRRVVYHSGSSGDHGLRLYSAPIDGGDGGESFAPVLLTPALVQGGGVYGFRISADSRRVLYLADQDTLRISELYSVPVDASAVPIKLSLPLGPGGLVALFELTPDGNSVVFRSDPDRDESAGPDRIYCQRVAGGALLEIAANADDALNYQNELRLSPDGTRAVYPGFAADQTLHLFSAPLDGSSAPVQLSSSPEGEESIRQFEIAADGRRVLYRASAEPRDHFPIEKLFSVSIHGEGRPVRLDHPASGGLVVGDVSEFLISPDGARSLFITQGEYANLSDELFTVQTPATRPVRIFPQEAPEIAAWRLSGLQVSADSRWVVLQAAATGMGAGLYAIALDGHTGPVRLTESSTDGSVSGYAGLVREFHLAPDGQRVVYTVLQQYLESAGSYTVGLYSIPIDGSEPPAELDDFADADSFIGASAITPDGGSILFLGGHSDYRFELYRVPIDGSEAPVRLDGPLVANGRVEDFRLSPDGVRALYLASQDRLAVSELFSVPVDGSVAPVKLNGPLAPTRSIDAASLQISSDSRRVVYRADQETNDVFELFSALIDGSAPAVKLNGPLVSEGDVLADFALSPDGTRVVYHADAASDETYELFSVPIDGSDGSLSAVRLNGPLAPGGDVLAPQPLILSPQYHVRPFRISPDGQRVVYVADERQDEVFELFSVSIDRSDEPLWISAPAQPFSDVRGGFDIGSQGVVFVADAQADEQLELFVAPIDGRASPRRLHADLVAGGDVASDYYQGIFDFRLAPDGERVLYRADQDTDEVFELYQSPLTRAPRGGTTPTETRRR